MSRVSRLITGVLAIAFFVLAFAFFMEANPISYVVQGSWISSAEAVVGHPATPVSYAGVARRTTRRN